MLITTETVISSMPKNSRGNDSDQKRFLIKQTSSAGKRGNLFEFCSSPNWQDAAIRAADVYFEKIGEKSPNNVNKKIGYGLIALAGQNPCYKKGWKRGAWKGSVEIIEILESAVMGAGDIALSIGNLPTHLRSKLKKADSLKIGINEDNIVINNTVSLKGKENQDKNNTHISSLQHYDPVAARAARLRTAPKIPEKISVTIEQFKRNPDVVDEVLYQAKGLCSHCNMPAPFLRALDGTPYLEVHHVIPLSQGGEDTVDNAIALCPNCHRKAHFG